MKIRVFSFSVVLFCLITSISFSLYAQRLNGPWFGELNVGGNKLGIIFKFSNQNGVLSCTMDVPMQSLKDFGIQVVKQTETQIELKSTPLGASFKGEIANENLIKGFWSQSGATLPLDLKPGVGEKVIRPQEPHGPFAYETKELAFYNSKDDVWLAGTLTYPLNYSLKINCPVVLLVSGSGPQNRDEEIYGHKPFLVLADYLARNGIASLRYDDRGVGKSTGDLRNCTTEDFMEDARAGVNHLKNKYHFNKIGVIGHSEGGLIAFMLAAANEIDFMVSMAGTGIKGDSLMLEQINAINRSAGQSACINMDQMKQQLGAQMDNPWMKWFFQYDPTQVIASVKIPVMALNGSKDVQVSAKSNLSAIRSLLKNGHSKNLVKEYPGLNHLFQHCNTGGGFEYYEIEETLSAEVLKDIAVWINQL